MARGAARDDGGWSGAGTLAPGMDAPVGFEDDAVTTPLRAALSMRRVTRSKRALTLACERERERFGARADGEKGLVVGEGGCDEGGQCE